MYNSVTDQPAFTFRQGTVPLLISMPHVGTHIPAKIAERMTEQARLVSDTDWHLQILYDFAEELGASVLAATHSRYVIDLNRPPDGSSLYPGQSVTGLCPVDTFDDMPIYLPGQAPDKAETFARRNAIWHPYHEALAGELVRMKAQHGIAALWDAHSIRSVLPRFFEGKLPDLNLGTNKGSSCNEHMAQEIYDIAKSAKQGGYTAVLNGRFTGGYITRQYGCPTQNIHAIQLEMTQSSYMQETPPFNYVPRIAADVQPYLRRMLESMLGSTNAFKHRGPCQHKRL
ncbi:MAG: N-formylglutamate deformylase [Advenella sp.]